MVKQDFEGWFLSGWFGFHQLGDTQMQSPTRSWVVGHASASAKRIKCSGVLALMCMVVAGTLCKWYYYHNYHSALGHCASMYYSGITTTRVL